jgi:hypothetical protein
LSTLQQTRRREASCPGQAADLLSSLPPTLAKKASVATNLWTNFKMFHGGDLYISVVYPHQKLPLFLNINNSLLQ